MTWLAADIGGTKTLVALFEERRHEESPPELVLVREARYRSDHYSDLATLLLSFLGDTPVDGAGLAVAGPVVNQQAKLTNLPWSVDGATTATQLKAPALLINDFAAAAWGIDSLSRDEHVELQSGGELSRTEPDAPLAMAVIGPGTGLGKVVIVRPRDQMVGRQVLSSEGGHADFAPRNPFEDDLLAELRRQHGRVSIERVVSGAGLVAMYRLAVQRGTPTQIQKDVDARGAAAIGEHAHDAAAVEARRRFVSALGAEAGNFALQVLLPGGLWIAGGMAPKLRNAMNDFDEIFLSAMCDKGRMRGLLENTRVRLITDARIGLRGAALVAQAAFAPRIG